MAFQGSVVAILLTQETTPEAVEIVNIIAEDDDRDCRNVAERLIIEAGEKKAEEIKKRKAKEAKK